MLTSSWVCLLMVLAWVKIQNTGVYPSIVFQISFSKKNLRSIQITLNHMMSVYSRCATFISGIQKTLFFLRYTFFFLREYLRRAISSFSRATWISSILETWTTWLVHYVRPKINVCAFISPCVPGSVCEDVKQACGYKL